MESPSPFFLPNQKKFASNLELLLNFPAWFRLDWHFQNHARQFFDANAHGCSKISANWAVFARFRPKIFRRVNQSVNLTFRVSEPCQFSIIGSDKFVLNPAHCADICQSSLRKRLVQPAAKGLQSAFSINSESIPAQSRCAKTEEDPFESAEQCHQVLAARRQLWNWGSGRSIRKAIAHHRLG